MPDDSASQGSHTELRDSGIDILGKLPWGSHFCNFFDSKEDLLHILIPYFKAGLINNEFCLWITSDPVSVEDAYEALRIEIQDFDKYERKGQIMILSHADWYTKDGTFVPDTVINGWYQQLRESLNKGFDGMRVSGNEAWLDREVWKDFIDYERKLNNSLTDKRMIVLCTYPLAKCDAQAVFDVSQVHQIAATRRNGDWEIVEVPAIKKTKSQLAREKKELEDKVAERTKELTVLNTKLEKEIEQHRITRDALLISKARFLTVFEATDTAYLLIESDLTILLFNHQAAELFRKVFNWNLETGGNIRDFITAERQVLFTDKIERALKGEQVSYETSWVLENGSSLWYHVKLFPVLKGDGAKGLLGIVLALNDITERKLLENLLEREKIEKQREITDAVITAEEKEREEIGRELHDNIQQILVGARLYLSLIKKEGTSDLGYSFIQQTDQIILSGINEIRKLSQSIITPFIEETTMMEAIEKLISNTTAASGIEISMEAIGLDEEKLPEKLRLTIYRIIQEQFSNILKYSKASTASLKIVEDNEKLTLTIKDNGIGCDTSKKASGTGLINIKARASLLNGEVTIRSSPGEGFELHVIMKLI